MSPIPPQGNLRVSVPLRAHASSRDIQANETDIPGCTRLAMVRHFADGGELDGWQHRLLRGEMEPETLGFLTGLRAAIDADAYGKRFLMAMASKLPLLPGTWV